MNKSTIRFGKVSGYQRIYIIPSLHIDYQFGKFNERHNISINLIWIAFGVGMGVSWENKNRAELPDIPDPW